VLGNRVSLRISRKMADILKVHKAIYAAHQQQNPAAKAQQLQLQQELNRLYESLRATVRVTHSFTSFHNIKHIIFAAFVWTRQWQHSIGDHSPYLGRVGHKSRIK
jgi:hypothetical protein